ncbi:MAG: pyruvate ferredoxin oxidoreductase [Thermoproteota archaeon]|nr:MAG: pyruvate ferredoxin oxidoreductase [Candidatus Korarchaeota archaeon]
MMAEQQVLALNGDEAVALAVKQCNVDVVAAYPITPQTIIVERFSEYVHDGEVKTKFIRVESEHSALSACVGAAAAGARAFTATAANGLALMHEIVYIAASLRTPVVMAIVNRALSGPINIHCDHADSMAERDSGWVQLYTEDAQEAYDTVIQAFRIAEHPDVQLPVMVMLDGFLVSHTLQNVKVLPDKTVAEFVGQRKPVNIELFGEQVPLMLNPEKPVTFGPLDLYDYYYEHKMQQIHAMTKVPEVVRQVHDEYAKISGRSYGDGILQPYMMEDAEIALVGLSSTMGTVRTMVDKLRDRGIKAGALRIKMFRPFPHKQVAETLQNVKAVGVLDRSASIGAQGGPVFMEVRTALYDLPEKPVTVDFIYGLGGRDAPPTQIEQIFQKLREALEKKPEKTTMYIGVRT